MLFFLSRAIYLFSSSLASHTCTFGSFFVVARHEAICSHNFNQFKFYNTDCFILRNDAQCYTVQECPALRGKLCKKSFILVRKTG